jgi:hypothetical protein
MQILFIIWICGIILKALGFKPLQNISWGWFVLAPFIIIIVRLLGRVFMYAFAAFMLFFVLYYVADFGAAFFNSLPK